MVDLKEEVVSQLEKHEETLQLDEFVRWIETHHREDGPGVDLDLVEAYAEAVYFDVDLSAIDDRLTDSDDWESGKHLYDLGDGRISKYPPEWHERLAGTDDIRDVIELIQTDVTEAEGDQREAVTEERGVPQPKLLRVCKAIGGIDEEAARERIKELRQNDEIEEFASQHRDPTIRLR
jgi:hypothetical protein